MGGVRISKQDAKLIDAKPGDQVSAADVLPEARRNLAEQAITDLVAEGVIDLSEIVEVEHQNSQAGSLGKSLLDLLTEHQSVGKVGQAIVQRLVLQRPLPFLLAPP